MRVGSEARPRERRAVLRSSASRAVRYSVRMASYCAVGVSGGGVVMEGRGGEGDYLCFAAFLQDDAVDAAAEVGVDGFLVAVAEVLEHAEGGVNDFLVAGEAGTAE